MICESAPVAVDSAASPGCRALMSTCNCSQAWPCQNTPYYTDLLTSMMLWQATLKVADGLSSAMSLAASCVVMITGAGSAVLESANIEASTPACSQWKAWVPCTSCRTPDTGLSTRCCKTLCQQRHLSDECRHESKRLRKKCWRHLCFGCLICCLNIHHHLLAY